MARIRRDPKDPSWPSWRYGPNGEAAIFPDEASVPDGWVRKPGEAPTITENRTMRYNKDELIQKLKDKNIKIDPTWGAAQMVKVLGE